MKWSDFDRWLKAEHLQGKARVLMFEPVVIEEVYSQAEKLNRPAPVLYFRETKKGLARCPVRTRTRCRCCSGTTWPPASARRCIWSRRQCGRPAGSA